MDEAVKNSDEEQKESIKRSQLCDEESKENKSEGEEEVVDDESQDAIALPPFGPRTEVFQVYSLTDNSKILWLEQSRIH